MANWRTVLRFRDTSSGLTWTISGYYSAAAPSTVKTAASAWVDLYMAACNTRVRFVDARFSDVDLQGDVFVYVPSDFNVVVGQSSNSLLTLAEAGLLTGRTNALTSQGRSRWYLHGLDSSNLAPDGSIDPTAANITALVAGSGAYLRQFRAEATPEWEWPPVNPAVPYLNYEMNGPYVRRLGNPFTLPGQRRRYTRSA